MARPKLGETVESCNKELDDLEKRRQEILKRKKKLEEADNKKIGAMIRRIFKDEITSMGKAEQKAFFENLCQLRKDYLVEFDIMMAASGFEKKEPVETTASESDDKAGNKTDEKSDETKTDEVLNTDKSGDDFGEKSGEDQDESSDEQPEESNDDGSDAESEEELSDEQTEESGDEAGSDEEFSGEESVHEDASGEGEQDG